MGSGSSKKSSPAAKPTAPPKPVANVNKQENSGREQCAEIEIKQQSSQKENEKNSKKREENEYNNNKKKEKENKKMKIEPTPKETMITFEDESDLDNDIDEVLKMPMAIEYPKPKKKDKKDKKNKGKEAESYDNKLERDLFNSNSQPNDNGYSRNDEELPETYAQRLQRKQYKLQQDFLIRQKTMHRNTREWDDYDEGDDGNEGYQNTGFDASKFRAANQGGDLKKELFKTSTGQEELETPRYLQSDPVMEDLQVNKGPASPRHLPSYNQSEIDLMQELERDFL